MTNDETTSSVRDKNPLSDVQASVSCSVYGSDDSITGHLHAAGLPNNEYDAFMCSRVKTSVWGDLDICQALQKVEYILRGKTLE